jgi:hypothetical protein
MKEKVGLFILLGLAKYTFELWLILSLGVSGAKTLSNSCDIQWQIDNFPLHTTLFCKKYPVDYPPLRAGYK